MEQTLVTLSEVTSRTGIVLNDVREQEAAGIVLDGLVASLETYAGRPLIETSVTEVRGPHRGGDLILRKRPVTSVESVTATPYRGGAPVAATVWSEAAGIGLTDLPAAYQLTIVYTAGVPGGEPAAKFAVLEAAARILRRIEQDEDGLESVAQEGYRVKFITETFTEGELAGIARTRRIAG